MEQKIRQPSPLAEQQTPDMLLAMNVTLLPLWNSVIKKVTAIHYTCYKTMFLSDNSSYGWLV
jgi:hypothetical protein